VRSRSGDAQTVKPETFARVLVATDGSEPAHEAVSVCIAVARASGATVRVVHVWNMELHHQHGLWDVEMRSEAKQLIAATVDRFRLFGVKAEGAIVRADSDHIAAAVAEEARCFDADLIVVGSRGLSDWQALLTTQSVSHQLLTKVDCPILVVRGPSSASSHRSQRVLLAVAGGDDVEPAVAAAAAVTLAPGSAILVLHVAQAMLSVQGVGFVEPDEEIQQTVQQARALLKEAGVPVSGMVAPPGPVARTVMEVAAKWGADMIVIGSSRIGDLGSILFGSVTHSLMRTSDRPVLVAGRVR
jgi:nucleotide-binding universal stress UspA family protein